MKNVMAKMKKRKGFTLVELIVVIAMIGVLAGIAVPSYQGYRERADIANDVALADLTRNAILVAMADETIIRPTAAAADSAWIGVINNPANNGVDVTFSASVVDRNNVAIVVGGPEETMLEGLINGGNEATFSFGDNELTPVPAPGLDGGVIFFLHADGRVTYEVDGRDYFSENNESRNPTPETNP